MRRLSARLIIATFWIISLAIAIVAARLGTGPAIVAGIASAALIFFSLNYLGQEQRAATADLRKLKTHTQELGRQAASAEASQRQLLAVTESITEGIIQVSESARFVHVNAAAREMLNLPTNVDGQPAAAIVRNPELRMSIERAASGTSFDPIEIILDERNLLVSPRPIRGTGQNAQGGAVLSIVDFTEFRRIESVRRDFVANVSHELKTPLTSIRGYTETLLSDDLSPELQRQFLEIVHKNADRIQRIVDDLLDLSRLQSGGWQPELQEVDAAVLAEDVWASCEGARKKNISFAIHAAEERDVLADPGGLRQILSNLFDNAIRYTPEGGRVIVSLRAANDNDDDFIELDIRDNGNGIPRDSLPRIFERFYRVDAARSRNEGGTGLGLSIVKHLVERMSGEVSAESELGKGTTIHLKLPAVTK